MSEFWSGRKVLVTGAEGLIGRPLCRLLHERGASAASYDAVNGMDILHRELLEQLCRTAAKEGGIVIHLAAQSNVEPARANPHQTFQVNVQGTVNVLEAAREAGVKAVVVASSNHVYGKQDAYPTKEDAPLRQLDTYSASKIAADYIARSYAHNYGLPVAIIRNTNCYGAGDPHRTHLIPGTVLSLLKHEQPVIRGTGETRKAYLYVDDVAEAYLKAAEWMANGGTPGEVFNISTESLRVVDVVDVAIRAMGLEGEISPIIQGQPNDQSDEHLDWTKAKEVLGWSPTIPLMKGVIRTAEWLTEQEGVRV